MHNCKLLLIVGLLSLLFSACLKHHSSASLVLFNKSGEDLWVESFIVSSLCDSTISFLLQDGLSQRIAKSEQCESGSYNDLSLKKCVFNEDAYVRVYKLDSLGERRLAHIWYYANRNNDGNELFNEASNNKTIHSNADGDVVVSYLFKIIPEDIAGNNINMNTN
jgi:hypothetical protein